MRDDTTWPANWPKQAQELHIFDPRGDVLLQLLRDVEEGEPTDVHLRASSSHLILASPNFATLLGPNFREGQTLRSEGSVAILLDEDDPDATIILMNIVHGKTRQVPRTISFDMLVDIAMLVDKRDILEVIEPFTDIWIANQQIPLPTSYSSNVMMWLMISWVFEKPQLFAKMGQILERQGDVGFGEDGEGLPLPAGLVESLLKRRVQAIKSATGILYSLITKYSGGSYAHCNSTKHTFGSNPAERRLHCDRLVHGSLTTGAIACGLWPRLRHPREGTTFASVVSRIRGIRIVSGCPAPLPGTWSPHHGISAALEQSLRDLEVSLGSPSFSYWHERRNHTLH